MLSQLTAIYFEQSARSKGPDPTLLGPSALGLACVSCRVWVQLSAAHLDYDCDSRSAQPRGLLYDLRALCLSRALRSLPSQTALGPAL